MFVIDQVVNKNEIPSALSIMIKEDMKHRTCDLKKKKKNTTKTLKNKISTSYKLRQLFGPKLFLFSLDI